MHYVEDKKYDVKYIISQLKFLLGHNTENKEKRMAYSISFMEISFFPLIYPSTFDAVPFIPFCLHVHLTLPMDLR